MIRPGEGHPDAAGRMAKTSAETLSGSLRRTQRRAALGLVAAAALSSPPRRNRLPIIRFAPALSASVVWWAVTAGTAFAALVAFGLYLHTRRDERLAAAEKKISGLSTALDRTAALLDADDQRTIVWESAVADPQVFGGLPERVGVPVEKNALLTFRGWLSAESAIALEAAADKLRRHGEGFQTALRTTGGALVEATGRTSGRRAILRLRELTGERRSFAELKEQAVFVISEVAALRALADLHPDPALAAEPRRPADLGERGLCPRRRRSEPGIRADRRHRASFLAHARRNPRSAPHRKCLRRKRHRRCAGVRRQFKILDTPIEDGSIGAAIDVSEVETISEKLRQSDRVERAHARRARRRDRRLRPRQPHPVPQRRVPRDLGPDRTWLASAPDEGAILDQLRADRKLPEQSNYRDWRARHLAAYQSNEASEDLWHLPDGRTLRVVALPNSDGGMTYIYENVTQEIMLESRLTALSQLQGETLDHLSEAVAVFGTDGRLRLFNPVFAEIWRLSPTHLRSEPHISEIIADCRAIHADKEPWDEIRAAVTDIDHDENVSGRMARPDGSVIDYATVALPEGMTMLTFVDVTDSARFERILKERNEALEAADRLKSDFIQHVSYELRSPLQNIIGQAELIAAQTFGKLNAKQREYMDDIMGSSRELSALINDILHLATIDAGIVSLDIQRDRHRRYRRLLRRGAWPPACRAAHLA